MTTTRRVQAIAALLSLLLVSALVYRTSGAAFTDTTDNRANNWAAAYCWALLWLQVWTIVPRAFDWSPNVIESGSMAPLIRLGDVVVTEPCVELDDLSLGQIVTFTNPIDGQLTTHRINAVDRDELTTKGDANQVADTTPVERADVQGRARIVVAAVGLPESGSTKVAWPSPWAGSHSPWVRSGSRSRPGADPPTAPIGRTGPDILARSGAPPSAAAWPSSSPSGSLRPRAPCSAP